jgi:hypothetical protein
MAQTKKKSRRIRISGKKRKCQDCGHKHKQMGKGKPWFCMKQGCPCPGLMVAGERV